MGKCVITKEQFINYMEVLMGIYYLQDELVEKLEDTIGVNDHFLDIFYKPSNLCCEMLGQLVGEDRDNFPDGMNTIDWYIYETEMGKKDPRILVDDKEYKVHTPEELWEVIELTNEE